MACYYYLRNVQDLVEGGKTLYEKRFGKPFMVECCPISAKDQSRLHQFGKKKLPGICLGYALYADEIGETFWSQTLRSWKRWTHRKSTQTNSMQRKL